MIDIDVLKGKMLGSPEGARKFAAFLRTWFPNLYVEASTGGKGQHAYLLVRKLGLGPGKKVPAARDAGRASGKVGQVVVPSLHGGGCRRRFLGGNRCYRSAEG